MKYLTMPKELRRSQTFLGPYSGPGLGTQRWIQFNPIVGTKFGKGEIHALEKLALSLEWLFQEASIARAKPSVHRRGN